MNNELYRKLVDLYAERALTEDVDAELERAAEGDEAMKADMRSLRAAVDQLHDLPAPQFTEESYQRILMKVYARGVEMQTRTPSPAYLQFPLPIQN
ncbi:MAG: hypothetical protein JST35_01655 [Armatimonadetes bacterium]|jgi:hypothetical protein|nr:hypothetical protein [Armatimonadota bacterium]